MSLKFGTSGLRGLSIDLVGQASAVYAAAFGKHLLDSKLANPGDEILVGRDFRESSPEISSLCIGALQQIGFNISDCGPIPTPALALLGLKIGAASLMVTGSHIPADRNGIKFYRPDGEIDKQDEIAIAANAKRMFGSEQSVIYSAGEGADRASEALVLFGERNNSMLPPYALQGMKVGVYQHSSVVRDLFVEVLQQYGAKIFALGRSEIFIPVDTEAVPAETANLLKYWTKEHQLDAIVSADGDGDRPLVADETGQPLRGDLLGLIAAEFIGADVVVTPVTSNSGIERSIDYKVVRTKVGSPFVIAGMMEALKARAKNVMGFEANGGCLTGSDVVLNGRTLTALPTRDSFLPVLAVLGKAAASKKPLSAVAASYELPFALSDRLEHFRVETSAALMTYLRASNDNLSTFLSPVGTPSITSDIDGLRVTLTDGRMIHFRPSGNAPEMRCYVEAAAEKDAETLMKQGLQLIRDWAGKH